MTWLGDSYANLGVVVYDEVDEEGRMVEIALIGPDPPRGVRRRKARASTVA